MNKTHIFIKEFTFPNFMIVNKNLLEEVKKFGLNTYEAKIWTALLSRGVSTAGELAEIANVPRSRSYDVLESLEKKGFINMKVGKPIQYLAITPDQVISRVQKKVSEDADYHLNQLETLKTSEILGELNSLHNNGIETLDPLEVTSLLRGRDNIVQQIGSLIKNAEKDVKLALSDEGMTRKLNSLQRYFNKAKKNGVNFEFVLPQKTISSETLQKLKEYGTVKKGENQRFAIIDGKHVVLMLADDNKINAQYDTAILAQSEYLANTVNRLL